MTPDKLREIDSRFEDWYVVTAFDYQSNPIGSRECGLQRAAWRAAHAAAIEEVERLKRENSLMAAHQGIDNHQRLIDRAEKAERRAERLKGHAEAMAEELEDVFGDHETVAAYRAEFKEE